MTAADLRDILEELESRGVDLSQIPIKCAMQPNYPFEYSVGADIVYLGDDPDEYGAQIRAEIWVYEQKQVGYLKKDIREALNW